MGKGIVTAFAAQAKLSSPVQNLFALLAENGRLADAQAVADDFEKLVLAGKGAVEVTVTSMGKLAPNDVAALKTFLKQKKIFEATHSPWWRRSTPPSWAAWWCRRGTSLWTCPSPSACRRL